MGPTACALYRVAFGAACLFVLAHWIGKRVALSKRALTLAAIAGLVFALDLSSWHRSILLLPRTGTGLATVLANTQVVWVSLVGVLILGERGGWRTALCVVLALLGVAFVQGVIGTGTIGVSTAGVLFGLATGVFYAIYILTLRKAQAPPSPAPVIAFMAWTSLFSALFLIPGVLLSSESFTIPDARSWMCLLALAIVAQTIAWILLTTYLAKIPASIGALLLMLQPAFATLWGVLFFGEYLTVYELIGMALLIAAMYVGLSRPDRNEAAPESFA